MSWLHSQQSNFVFTVPILLEGTIYIYKKMNVDLQLKSNIFQQNWALIEKYLLFKKKFVFLRIKIITFLRMVSGEGVNGIQYV